MYNIVFIAILSLFLVSCETNPIKNETPIEDPIIEESNVKYYEVISKMQIVNNNEQTDDTTFTVYKQELYWSFKTDTIDTIKTFELVNDSIWVEGCFFRKNLDYEINDGNYIEKNKSVWLYNNDTLLLDLINEIIENGISSNIKTSYKMVECDTIIMY